MKFAGCHNHGGAIELRAPGPEVREASQVLGSLSLRLNRDLAALSVVDAGEPEPEWSAGTRVAYLTEESAAYSYLRGAYRQVRALVFSGSLSWPAAWGLGLGRGRVYALGARSGGPDLVKALRGQQRLLPLHEVSLKVAALSAVEESEDHPLWVSLHLDVLAPHLVPGVRAVAAGGASLEALREALEAVPGPRVVGFEIVGYPAPEKRNVVTALTGAELLRDNILTWWGSNEEEGGW